MSSFSTNKSKDSPAFNLARRYWNKPESSVLGYFRYKTPQNCASALSHCEVLVPSDFNFWASLAKCEIKTKDRTSKARGVRYLKASTMGWMRLSYDWI